jgi:hypothetical protein
MKGMAEVIAFRRAGFKPSCVMLDLVDRAMPGEAMVGTRGGVTVEVERTDSLADIDFRPLHGLLVIASNQAADLERFRRMVAMVDAVKPRRMAAATEEPRGYVIRISEPDHDEEYVLP